MHLAIRSCASMRRTRTSTLRKMRKSTVGFRKIVSRGYHARGGRVENPWWKLKKQLYGKRKAAKKLCEFVVSATVGLGLEQCPEQPSLFQRPGTTLIFGLHQDGFHVSGSNVELARLHENLMGCGSQYSYLRATRKRVYVCPSRNLHQERSGHLGYR